MPPTPIPLTVNDESFERWVLQSELPVAVLFCTPKFANCQTMRPRWDGLAQQFGDRLRVALLTVDDNRRWARHFKVTALPTTLWFRNGKAQQRAEGLLSEAELRERAEALIAGRDPKIESTPSKGPLILTDASFAAAIRSETPTLVDFWAAWCGPCRMIAPVIERLADQMGDRATIAKLNVDENPRTAQQFNVRSIPMLLIFKNGQVVDQLVGAQPEPVIRQRLEAALRG
ncbi:MAG: thioredoxin [Anaerolineales bacterium]|nr:thioredoxin [Anaerolineales bacterium]MCB9126588.1 thioredoxin [Ardenticatenales bacterium]